MHTVVMFSFSPTERKLQNEVRMEQPEREAASTAEKKKAKSRGNYGDDQWERHQMLMLTFAYVLSP